MKDLHGKDYIDSEDVIENVDELENDIQNLSEELDELIQELDALEGVINTVSAKDVEKVKGQIDDHKKTISETKEELRPYKDLAEQCQNYGEWRYGTRLIHKREFKNYAREFAEDIGVVDKRADWPMNCIDWDQAADELENDYSSFDFDGEEYLMRD